MRDPKRDPNRNLTATGQKLRAGMLRDTDRMFNGRKFRYIREFHLSADQRVLTAMGRKVRHGFVVQDIETGEHLVVGLVLLRAIADRYYGIELPPEIRMRRMETSIVRGSRR